MIDKSKSYQKAFFLLGDQSSGILKLLAMFLVSSLLELTGISLIGPFVQMAAGEYRYKKNIESIFESAGIYSNQSVFVFLGIGLLLIFLIKLFISNYVNYSITKFGMSVLYETRVKLIDVYLNMGYEKFNKENQSYYLNSVQNFTTQYTSLVLAVSRSISDLMLIALILILLAWTNILALLILASVLLACSLFYHIKIGGNLAVIGKNANLIGEKLVSIINECLEGAREIRIFGANKYFSIKFSEVAKESSENNIERDFISYISRPILEFGLVIFVVLVVIISQFLDEAKTNLISTLAIFAVAGLRLIPSVNVIGQAVFQIRYSREAVNAMYRDLNNKYDQPKADSLGAKISAFEVLDLKDVSYKYPDAGRASLKNVSLSIKRGDVVGICGQSGSGKTTLINIILGLLKPTEGGIYINGKNADEVLDWHNQIAYLPQNVFLINDSLKENIVLGNFSFDGSRLIECIRSARLSSVLNALEDSVNPRIGEKGVKLSGGQRQRVALARAFYYQRNILVLDESTSSLDIETENEIVEEIGMLKGRNTMIIVSHREAMLRECDYIFRVDDGHVNLM